MTDMRQRYLYRGKSKDGWVMGFYCETQGFNDTTLHLIHSILLGCEDYEIDLATLGQCTGYSDKNGRLIYEGDVVQWAIDGDPEAKDIFEIEWKRGAWSLAHLPKKAGCNIDRWLWPSTYNGNLESLKIIGNVHDNPELLEVTA